MHLNNLAAKYIIGDITVSASRYYLTAMVGENKVDAVQVAYNRDHLSLAARLQSSNDMRFYQGLKPSGEIVKEKCGKYIQAIKFTIFNYKPLMPM
ncbi:hypothetical protein PTRA_a1240 [Pseudoalteromonas translucida KMM 520]|uniref:Uncharacterized protein n=1 Tax=Pseudoalteromonas translucida KMM 520 TaxID=1315283 RepID=A0A0U2VG82_9GAMM|nr:hypothetical protein [Pseudoalteromonas translucida]ALS32485.1 hypothetical protein PTRA_a1240 [Pseudoalteromonas translucida KMM 520]